MTKAKRQLSLQIFPEDNLNRYIQGPSRLTFPPLIPLGTLCTAVIGHISPCFGVEEHPIVTKTNFLKEFLWCLHQKCTLTRMVMEDVIHCTLNTDPNSML